MAEKSRPTPKQIGFAKWLSAKTKIPLPDGWNRDGAVCSKYLDHASYWERVSRFPPELQEHIKRIWRGELKHDPGPWDEGWSEESDAELDGVLLAVLRERGVS
jgi:hypothetical protein